jgi:hypothetical protein
LRFDKFSFGSIQIDGVTCDYDVVIDGGEIRKRKKKPSKQFRRRVWTYSPFHRGGHTLEMSAAGCRYWGARKAAGDERSEARSEAPKNRVAFVPTPQAIEALEQSAEETNAILHVTC